MDKTVLLEKLDQMTEILGTETMLEAIARAMSADELQSNLEYIDRMYETKIF